jgi:hypothetical protein
LYLNGEELQGRLVVPNDVDIIGRAAFCNCSGLTEVVIGNATTEIGERAFQGCSGLMSIIVLGDNPAYKSENGLLLSRDGKSLVQGVNGNVMIPNSVTNIASYAFYGCTNLTSIAMTDSVTGIGSYAFYGCGGLGSVTIPGGVTSIGDSAFWNCKSLDGVTFTGDAPAASSAFSFIKSDCVAYVKRTANGFPAEGAKWNDLTVRYYGGSVATGTMTEIEGCEYIIVANDDETLTERDITFTTVVGNTLVDTTRGYNVKVATDGKSATARLKTPTFGAVAVAEGNAPLAFDGSDPSGALVVVNENELAAKPTVKNGEEVGALPVAAVPGLYYQAAWGDDIRNLTVGQKVQATADMLYLGVIKQTGASGFYKVIVSEK